MYNSQAAHFFSELAFFPAQMGLAAINQMNKAAQEMTGHALSSVASAHLRPLIPPETADPQAPPRNKWGAPTMTISPFSAVWSFPSLNKKEAALNGDILVVAPNSGHDPTIMREVVEGLRANHNVHVFGCRDPRWIPQKFGAYGLEENTADIIQTLALPKMNIRHIVGTSQSGVVATAAVAHMWQHPEMYGKKIPDNLVVMGSPIDTRVNPNSMCWMAKFGGDPDSLFDTVQAPFPGAGRRVERGEVQERCFDLSAGHRPKSADPAGLQALPAEAVRDTLQRVYRNHDLPRGEWRHEGERVDVKKIGSNVLTVEARGDSIAPLGQASALYNLASSAPRRESRTVQGDHFDLVIGPRVKEVVAIIENFIRPIARAATAQAAPVVAA